MSEPLFSIDNLPIVKSYFRRMARLYVIWSAAYLPLAIYGSIYYKYSLTKSILLYIRNFFFTGEQYNSWPLWYLLATIYAALALCLLIKWKASERLIITIAIAALCISEAVTQFVQYDGELSGFFFLLQKLLYYSISTGRIFTGLFYITAGMLCSRLQKETTKSTFLFLILLFCYLARVNGVGFDFILLAISVICLFCVALAICLPDRHIYQDLRKISTKIYFIHMYVFTFFCWIAYGDMKFGWSSFLITSILSFLIASFVQQLQNHWSKSAPNE